MRGRTSPSGLGGAATCPAELSRPYGTFTGPTLSAVGGWEQSERGRTDLRPGVKLRPGRRTGRSGPSTLKDALRGRSLRPVAFTPHYGNRGMDGFLDRAGEDTAPVLRESQFQMCATIICPLATSTEKRPSFQQLDNSLTFCFTSLFGRTLTPKRFTKRGSRDETTCR